MTGSGWWREQEVLKRYFPQCLESENFSMERFKAALPEGVGTKEETVGFNWLRKNYARMLTNMDTTTVTCLDTKGRHRREV